MDAERVGPCMCVMVRRTAAGIATLFRDDRHAAVWPDHVFYEMSGLAHHRTPADLVPADGAVVEHDVKMAVIVHGRRDLARQSGPDRVDRDGTRARHLAHDVDVM